MGAEKAHPVRTPAGMARQGEGGVDGAEEGHDPQIDGDDEGEAQGDPGQVADEDVDHAERRGQHGEVGAHPLDGPHDRVHGVVATDLHGGGGQESGGQEVDVLHTADGVGVVVHQRAEPDADGRQIEHGVEEAGGDRAAPGPLVLVEPVAERAGPEGGGAPPGDGNGHSTRDRPVRWRKTSSRVDRRTRETSGWQPVRCTSARVASPSSV